MKRLVLVVCATLAVLIYPLGAIAQPAHADSPKTTLILSEGLAVGPTMLQPGEYRFQCRTFDGKTFLVVTSVQTGKEVTRVPCVREMLDAKVTASEFRSLLRADGTRALTVVRIKGEMVEHHVVN
jgi:hypothetical protein